MPKTKELVSSFHEARKPHGRRTTSLPSPSTSARTATFASPDSNLTYGMMSSNTGGLPENKARKVGMWLRDLMQSTVSKKEGDKRGGGKRRGKMVHKQYERL